MLASGGGVGNVGSRAGDVGFRAEDVGFLGGSFWRGFVQRETTF